MALNPLRSQPSGEACLHSICESDSKRDETMYEAAELPSGLRTETLMQKNELVPHESTTCHSESESQQFSSHIVVGKLQLLETISAIVMY
jgi:hypothetical protein